MKNPCKTCNIFDWTDFDECLCELKIIYENEKPPDNCFDLDRIEEAYDYDPDEIEG